MRGREEKGREGEGKVGREGLWVWMVEVETSMEFYLHQHQTALPNTQPSQKQSQHLLSTHFVGSRILPFPGPPYANPYLIYLLTKPLITTTNTRLYLRKSLAIRSERQEQYLAMRYKEHFIRTERLQMEWRREKGRGREYAFQTSVLHVI